MCYTCRIFRQAKAIFASFILLLLLLFMSWPDCCSATLLPIPKLPLRAFLFCLFLIHMLIYTHVYTPKYIFMKTIKLLSYLGISYRFVRSFARSLDLSVPFDNDIVVSA